MFKRFITQSLLTALSDTPVVFLNGARQTGKSTLVHEICNDHYPARYITMDDPTVLAAAKNDPVSFIHGLTDPVILDEVQKAVELFPVIKMAIDENRKPGRFLFTGSTNILLLPSLSESLAGRMEILHLYPLSQGEIAGHKEHFIDYLFAKKYTPELKTVNTTVNSMIAKMIAGGYPEVLARSEPRRKAWFNSYITTILQRDIRDLANIEGLTNLPNLLKLLATRTSSLLNLSDLSRSIQVPHTTLKRYFNLLETTFLCYSLPAWSNNLGLRLVKSPKVYLNDTGLVAALLGINQQRLEEDRMLLGAILENFVVTELQKQRTWSETQPALYHFRTAQGQEVDVILEDASGKCVGIEIKLSATLSSSDISGMNTFAEIAGNKFHRGIILYMGKENVALGKNIYAVPLMQWF